MWGSHLGLQAILLPLPSFPAPNYGRCLQQLIGSYSYQQLWVRIPLTVPPSYHRATTTNFSTISEQRDGWDTWDSFRHLCNHHPKLCIALEVGEDLPDDLEALQRWNGEPVRAVILSTKLFLTNRVGFPVLSQRHQVGVLNQSTMFICIYNESTPFLADGIGAILSVSSASDIVWKGEA